MSGKRAPKKNIVPVFVDVKKPDFDYRNSIKFADLDLTHVPLKPEEASRPFPIFKWSFAILTLLLLVSVGITAWNLGSVRQEVEKLGVAATENFATSFQDMKNFDVESATASLKKSRGELGEIDKVINQGPYGFIFNAVSNVLPIFKEAGGFLKGITALNIDLIKLSDTLSDLQVNGFNYFQNEGETLVERVRVARDFVEKIDSEIKTLRSGTSALKGLSYFDEVDELIGDYYLSYGNDLYMLENFLDGFLAILDSEERRNILLIFQNPSEIRPAGGFIGSYAVLGIEAGEMVDLDVRDIYDPDGQLDVRVIPPEPLQYIVTDWETRDSNWFFDFPTSAKAVLSFMEASKIYREREITFDGVIALNVNVLESMLGILGPIELAHYELVIDENNFLEEIQKEVEAGKDKEAGHPKKILQVMAPMLLEKMKTLSLAQKKQMSDLVSWHLSHKNVMIFAKDKRMASFFHNFHLDGSVYELPSSFWGAYLGVVNANIAGGKSDAFIKQEIDFWVDISSDGGIVGDLAIRRAHRGYESEYPWYRALNKNYIKIFANPGANLIFMEGNDSRRRIIKDYDVNQYTEYEALKEIEDSKNYLQNYDAWSGLESGKRFFSTWFNTPVGEVNTINLRYEVPGSDEFVPESGRKFKFVFDSQSGADTFLKVTISAPLGFLWEETGSPTFLYESNNPEKRIILELTPVR